jgi:hypothetical protein
MSELKCVTGRLPQLAALAAAGKRAFRDVAAERVTAGSGDREAAGKGPSARREAISRVRPVSGSKAERTAVVARPTDCREGGGCASRSGKVRVLFPARFCCDAESRARASGVYSRAEKVHQMGKGLDGAGSKQDFVPAGQAVLAGRVIRPLDSEFGAVRARAGVHRRESGYGAAGAGAVRMALVECERVAQVSTCAGGESRCVKNEGDEDASSIRLQYMRYVVPGLNERHTE